MAADKPRDLARGGAVWGKAYAMPSAAATSQSSV
jgi:hypothetical protein